MRHAKLLCELITKKKVPHLLKFICYLFKNDLQAVPTSNGTSFEFAVTENGPVCRDLYSTPQYKMDQPSDGTGELFIHSIMNISSLQWICKIVLLPRKTFKIVILILIINTSIQNCILCLLVLFKFVWSCETFQCDKDTEKEKSGRWLNSTFVCKGLIKFHMLSYKH